MIGISTAAGGFRLASVAERLNDSITALSEIGAPIVDLLIRFSLAAQFFRTGMLKTIDPEPTVWLFTFVHPIPGISPETATWLLTIAELAAPVLILVGLATRISALVLLFSAFLLHLAFPAVADHLYVMLLLGLIFVIGPGRFSLDHKFLPALVSSALPLTGVMLRLGAGHRNLYRPALFSFLAYRTRRRLWGGRMDRTKWNGHYRIRVRKTLWRYLYGRLCEFRSYWVCRTFARGSACGRTCRPAGRSRAGRNRCCH